MVFFFSLPAGGALSIQRNSILLSITASCLAVAAGLSHTIAFATLPILILATTLSSLAVRRPPPSKVLLVYFLFSIAIVGFFITYLRPLVQGWNTGETFGYTFVHSILASALMMGWPTVLLAWLGLVLLFHERCVQGWYWVTCSVCWALLSAVLPIVVQYHPAYNFPLALGPMVLAGCAAGAIFDQLRRISFSVSVQWMVVAGLMNLPSLASHYVDGSRPDMRTAAAYVKKNWLAGDQVTSPSVGLFLRYTAGNEPVVPLSRSKPIPQLDKLATTPGRLWVVIQSGRSGLSDDLNTWLGKHCSHELKVRGKRFDYYENSVDVFLIAHNKNPQ